MGNFSARRLQGHRNGQGLGAAQVADAAGCSVDDLMSYEDGRTVPPPELVAALAAALAVPVDQLEARHADPQDDYMESVISHADPLPDEVLRSLALIMNRRRRREPPP